VKWLSLCWLQKSLEYITAKIAPCNFLLQSGNIQKTAAVITIQYLVNKTRPDDMFVNVEETKLPVLRIKQYWT
jgi:hypothetical protein